MRAPPSGDFYELCLDFARKFLITCIKMIGEVEVYRICSLSLRFGQFNAEIGAKYEGN